LAKLLLVKLYIKIKLKHHSVSSAFGGYPFGCSLGGTVLDNIIKDLLFNFLIISFPILIYQLFISFQIPNKVLRQTLYGLLFSVSIVLGMMFPVRCAPGYIFDLRAIPWLTSILYGGFGPGLMTTFVLFGYWLYTDGQYISGEMGGFLLTGLLAFLLIPLFRNRSLKQRLGIVSGLTFLQVLFIFLPPVLFDKVHPGYDLKMFILYMFSYCLISLCGAYLVVYLVEKMQENARIRIELQRAEKLNTVSELAASIAHEIRNPMTTARGFMQLLSEEEVIGDKQRGYINMVIEELDRAHKIINNYLMFAKPKMEKTEAIDIAAQMNHIVDVISPYALINGVTIYHQYDNKLYVYGDRQQLTQALVNILKNGVEAMPQGGRLRIKIHKAGSSVQIDITDDGVGMTEEEIKRLGYPYYSTKENGTGLGMMVSFRIIGMMRGKIRVTSEKGKGTCFSVILPMYTGRDIEQ
jgi:two-component system sporulation sensor kinase B